MPQVMRKDCAGRHMTGDGKAFHSGPHLITAHGFSIRGEKNLAADDFFLAGVLPQLVAEFAGNEDGADLSFKMDVGASTTHGFNGDGGKLGHTDAGGTEGFDNKRELPPAAGAGGAQQLVVIGAAEGAVVGTKQFALHAQIAHATVRLAAKVKIAVQRCQHAVDGGGGIAGGKQMRFPTHNAGFFHGRAIEPSGEGAKMAQVIFDGAGAALFCFKVADIGLVVVWNNILRGHNNSSNDRVFFFCWFSYCTPVGQALARICSVCYTENKPTATRSGASAFYKEVWSMHIITISREFGSGGRELGKRLAEALGYAYYDREILTLLAEQTALDEAYLAHTLEESAPSALFPITIGQTFSVLPNYQAEYSTQLLQKQTALIKELATKSDCVIVGRNADIILREQDPLRLFVHADMEARIARCRRREMSGEDFTDKEYEKKIRQVDKNRAKTHGILATYDWGDRRGYDLCINTTHVTVRDIIPALAAYARTWADHHA